MSNDNNETLETLENTTEEIAGDGDGEGKEEKPVYHVNWSRAVERDEHGSVDKAKTLAKLEADLSTHIATNEFPMEQIASAVRSVFERLMESKPLKVSKDLDGVASRAFIILNSIAEVPNDSETTMINRIKGYVRGESKRFEATNGEQGSVLIVRGKSGGCYYSTPTLVKEYRARQAKKAAAAAK